MSYKNKIKKTVRLYPDTYELVEGYRGYTKEDFTGAVESLIIKGLDNFHSTLNIQKKLKADITKLSNEQKLLRATIVKILLEHTKLLAEIKAISKVHILKTDLTDNEELQNYINQSIKKAINSLREKKNDWYRKNDRRAKTQSQKEQN